MTWDEAHRAVAIAPHGQKRARTAKLRAVTHATLSAEVALTDLQKACESLAAHGNRDHYNAALRILSGFAANIERKALDGR
jgi:hypothetical protein